MFDPETLAFRFLGFEVWHKDPCRDGTDHSCGNAHRDRKNLRQLFRDLRRVAEGTLLSAGAIDEFGVLALDLLATIGDPLNANPVEAARAQAAMLVEQIYMIRNRTAARIGRARWWDRAIPIWLHVWHWRIRWRFYSKLLRWLFTRCEKCGKRFGWGEGGITSQWESDGPRWFGSERGIYHMPCHSSEHMNAFVAKMEAEKGLTDAS